ncbi:MAG: AraC family transcriptional regulator [Pseudomonadota bacterium]
MKTRIDTSHEMVCFVGDGAVDSEGWPANSIALGFDLSAGTVSFDLAPVDPAPLAGSDVVLIVMEEACKRVFGFLPDTDGDWHLPSDVRLVALAIRDCALPGPARETMRLGKSIELLCTTFDKLTNHALVPVDGARELSASEASQIVAARRLIDEHWQEKLTLHSIARECGLNRAKLTRGFRSMFDCSVADAIAERRLGGARQMLLSTDLPVSSVGYACGYMNNASFTRAFSRRYGLAPTKLRAAA